MIRFRFSALVCIAAHLLIGQAAYAQSSSNQSPVDWPNAESKANSDDWLVKNHDRIRSMHPRLLVLNYANGVARPRADKIVSNLIDALRESSRYHGARNPSAPPFLQYEVGRFVDLTDADPPKERGDGNSTRYPRVPNWKEGINFRYGQLFGTEFADQVGRKTSDGRRNQTLKEMVDSGEVHEVWFLAYQGNMGAPFESIEVKQMYDNSFRKLPGRSVPAGNGASPEQPFIGRSLRILFINVDRGPGCAMESLGHSLEGMARSDAVPYLKKYFEEYAGFDLKKRFGLPINNLYERDGAEINYPVPNSIEFTWHGMKVRNDNYVPVANNVHFMPNGRHDYDLDNPSPILTTMEHYRMFDGPGGKDKIELFTADMLDRYKQIGSDCMGRWVIYWRQNMPGWGNKAKDDEGKVMKNWWPFLFY